MNDNLKDKTIICKDCGEEFIFKAKMIVNEKGKEIMSKIALLDEKIKDLNSKGKTLEACELQKELVVLEYNKQAYLNMNSQEAYALYGFTNEPARCPECRRKIQENRTSRSR